MRELFDEYDTDGSGEISRDELYEIVERVIGSHTSSMHIVDVSRDVALPGQQRGSSLHLVWDCPDVCWGPSQTFAVDENHVAVWGRSGSVPCPHPCLRSIFAKNFPCVNPLALLREAHFRTT